jgi:short-subunit dehydrogenase involved in D-alanine esterification of teichoic acids
LAPIKTDVTSDEDVVVNAAKVATDVTSLINNAGVNHNTALMVAPDLMTARAEIGISYLAPLRVTRAFAPAPIANHGAVLNLLTILARVNLPFMDRIALPRRQPCPARSKHG